MAAKKAKILEKVGEDFEDVVETIIKKDKAKYMKQDVRVKKEKKGKKKKKPD